MPTDVKQGWVGQVKEIYTQICIEFNVEFHSSQRLLARDLATWNIGREEAATPHLIAWTSGMDSGNLWIHGLYAKFCLQVPVCFLGGSLALLMVSKESTSPKRQRIPVLEAWPLSPESQSPRVPGKGPVLRPLPLTPKQVIKVISAF